VASHNTKLLECALVEDFQIRWALISKRGELEVDMSVRYVAGGFKAVQARLGEEDEGTATQARGADIARYMTGATSTERRKIGGVGLQIYGLGVRFNSGAPTGLLTAKSPGHALEDQ